MVVVAGQTVFCTTPGEPQTPLLPVCFNIQLFVGEFGAPHQAHSVIAYDKNCKQKYRQQTITQLDIDDIADVHRGFHNDLDQPTAFDSENIRQRTRRQAD